MSFEVRIQRTAAGHDPDAVTVQPAGSLNTATAPELGRRLVPTLAGFMKDVVFDLRQLNFMSSAGLRLFSKSRKTLKHRGGQAAFVNLQPRIELALDVMKSLPGVAEYKDSADLDRYLALLHCHHPANR